MSVVSIVTDVAGQIGQAPRRIKIISTDNLATVTTAGYLNAAARQGFTLYPTDIVDMIYSYNAATNSGTYSVFLVSMVNGLVVLTLDVSEGNVTLPVVGGNLASFSGTTGLIADSNVVANKVLVSSLTSPDVNANLVSFDVTATAAQLAGPTAKLLFLSTGSKQYRVRNLWINLVGTNFSGGGGNRNLDIGDLATMTASTIPAATLGTLVNAAWGSASVPFSPTFSMNALTGAGLSLAARYSGGTTDYSTGSIVISGILERIV